MVNSPMNPSTYSIGASKRMKPLCSVPSQLNTLMADGTATANDSSENAMDEYSDVPATNMWWPHTKKLMTAIDTDDQAMNL